MKSIVVGLIIDSLIRARKVRSCQNYLHLNWLSRTVGHYGNSIDYIKWRYKNARLEIPFDGYIYVTGFLGPFQWSCETAVTVERHELPLKGFSCHDAPAPAPAPAPASLRALPVRTPPICICHYFTNQS